MHQRIIQMIRSRQIDGHKLGSLSMLSSKILLLEGGDSVSFVADVL